MCVTGAALWNTPSLRGLRCGQAPPVSPRWLAVRVVDRALEAVDDGTGKTCPAWRLVFCLGVDTDLLRLVVDPEDHHEGLQKDPVDAERQQDQDRVDDDQDGQAAHDPAAGEADDQET